MAEVFALLLADWCTQVCKCAFASGRQASVWHHVTLGGCFWLFKVRVSLCHLRAEAGNAGEKGASAQNCRADDAGGSDSLMDNADYGSAPLRCGLQSEMRVCVGRWEGGGSGSVEGTFSFQRFWTPEGAWRFRGSKIYLSQKPKQTKTGR